MTCIVGYKYKNTVYIGGDSAESNDNSITIRKDPKVFKNGEFIIGCTTSFRMIQLLRYSFNPPKIKDTQDIYEYMCTDFIGEVKNCFKKGGFGLTLDEYGGEIGGTFLVGYKDRLFKIYPDYQVAENILDMCAIGSGGDFALGALLTLSDDEDLYPEDKIFRSLEIAEELSLGVSRPFILIHT